VRRHLTYTNVMVTVAVVFAMSGGAYAASKYVINTTKQINPKVLAALKGKPGANGAQGPAGAVGAPGPAGAVGAKGEAGAAGQNGSPGEKGAQGEKGAAGSNGFNGTPGAKGAAGPTGPTGATGSPWTDGGTLPVGSSETGQWSFAFRQATETSQVVSASISFPIPLSSAISQAHSHFIGTEEGEGEARFNEKRDETGVQEALEKKECSGNYKEPKAATGNLCVFTQKAFAFPTKNTVNGTSQLETSRFTINDAETGEPHAGKSGAYLLALSFGQFVPGEPEQESKVGEVLAGDGNWVVTG
jgi:hypothetical protein